MSNSISASFNSITDNFEVMVTHVVYMGAVYKPAPAPLKLPALQALLAAVKDMLNQVSAGESALDLAIAQRAALYAMLPGLITQIVNTLEACCPDSPMLASVNSHVRKFRGQRASEEPTNPDGTPGNTHSTSDGSFGAKLKIFNDILNDLAKEPLYVPAEEGLTLVKLGELRDSLGAKNSAVTNARTALKAARTQRDALLFGKPNGLVPVAQQVKAYLKGAFGTKSPYFTQVKGLRFARR